MAEHYDVIVVGGGNAGLSAAHAAREASARVLVLDKAPTGWAGGNSYFTAGAFRTTFAGLDELAAVLYESDPELLARTDVSPYLPSDFAADMKRVTLGKSDPELTRVLVEEAAGTVAWLRDQGVRFRLQYERQAFEVDGRMRFWGNLPLGCVGGGKGLVEQHLAAAAGSGIEVRNGCPVVGLVQDSSGAITGVRCGNRRSPTEISAGAVILAAGGFEADPSRRAQFLGPGWDLARVRGTPYNTGEVLFMAIEAGAEPYGHWSGCHSVPWDARAPMHGDRELTNRLTKLSYPFGLMVNARGKRFVDEGADFRNYTYAKYGAEILRQPDSVAYQLFDARSEPLLRRDEYMAPGAARFEAATVAELACKAGLPVEALERTIAEFNATVQPGPFNPSVKDGKRTDGIEPPKSNWAQPLDSPPYLAYAVTCGITYTFGGVRIESHGRVLDSSGGPIPHLFAAGEMVGGLFYHNYPGGGGLMAGSVFGRRAGACAAAAMG